MSDFISWELMGTNSQISEAFGRIENVLKASSKIWVNKHQCKRITDRLNAVGKTLDLQKDIVGSRSSDGSQEGHPAFKELLRVLRKGEALVLDYVGWAGVISVLTRIDNREAFKEVHDELDTLKAQFPFEDASEDIECTSGTQRTVILTQDAEKDLEEMPKSLDNLASIDESEETMGKPGAMDLKKVKEVVSEKCDLTRASDDELPSYLRIDPATLETKDPVRKLERLSNQDPVEFDGWALVHSGRWLGCEFAIKVFKSGESSWNMKQMAKEVGSLMKLRHPHVVQLVGFAQDAERCSVLMELMDSDLRNFMKLQPGVRPFTRSAELNIIIQIARGMHYLHTQGYAHGELKCSNLLFKKDKFEVKISDLRSSQALGGKVEDSSYNQTTMPRRPRWTAPEAIKNYGGVKPSGDLLKKGDVYSFGMTCYEVVTGKLPFQDVFGKDLLEKIEAGERPELPGELDDRLKGLIQSCWNPDPDNRPDFGSICHILDFIWSTSNFAAENVSSGKDRVLSLFKRFTQIIVPISGLFRQVRGSEPRVEASTWGNMNEGAMEVDSAQTSTSALPVPEYLRIKPSELKKTRSVGKGASATVYEATWLGCTFAVKRMKSTLNIKALQQKLNFLIQLRHPYIVQLVGLSVESGDICAIVMEFMSENLRELIDSRQRKRRLVRVNSSEPACVVPFDLHEALSIIIRIAVGMSFLHHKGVLHRDLKATNVLVQEHDHGIDVKIADFGVSQHIDSSNRFNGPVGTGFWRAPEILRRSSSVKCDLKAADVYSFAMTCFEVLTGDTPLALHRHGDYESVIRGLRPTLPADLNSDLKVLIENCWHGDPEQRPNFTYICEELKRIQQALPSSTS